jgi:LysM repeat protein
MGSSTSGEPRDTAGRAGDEVRPPGLLRSALGTFVSAAVTFALGALLRSLWSGSPRTLDVGVELVVLGAGALAGVVLASGCGLLAASAVARAAGRTSRRLESWGARITPLAVRRALAVGVTATIAVGMASASATAAQDDLGWVVTSASAGTTTQPTGIGIEAATLATSTDPTSATAPTPGASTAERLLDSAGPAPSATPTTTGAAPLPGAASTTAPPAPGEATTPVAVPAHTAGTAGAGQAPSAGASRGTLAPTAAAATVVVEPGDTLWSIARSHLGEGATDIQIASAWPQWYAANRGVIGADPDLLRPGQRLVSPAGSTGAEAGR